jgi:pilus assembly protein CpaC
MTHQNKHTDVKNASRRIKRAGALLTAAAGAMVVLLATGAAAGQDASTGMNPAPATRPSMVTDGLSADGGVRLNVGKSVVVTVRRPFSKLSVGTPDIADVNTISPTSILVTAKKPGGTSLIIWDDQNRSESVDITVEQDLSSLRRLIKEAFPTLDIKVSPLNDTIALRGRVPAMQTSEQIVEMAATYGKVHNFLEISGGQQVMLQVRLAEVSKSALRNLGITFGGNDGVSAFSTAGFGPGSNTFNLGQAQPFTYVPGAASVFGSGRFGAVTFDYLIQALRTNNLLRDLAEPNLLTMSGQQASFLAGGQIPIPVPQPGNGGSTITIEYKDYGVSLNFTPQVLGNGRIRLLVNPDVSELDYSHSVSVSGTSVPGITKRTIQTTVELGDGQSFALAGLLQDDMAAMNTTVPLLGDLPILGNLFRSTSYQRSETELVAMVTPHLVAPMNPDQVPMMPGEKWRYPSEARQYLFADLGGPAVEKGAASTDSKTGGPAPEFHGTYGFSAAGTGSAKPQTP